MKMMRLTSVGLEIIWLHQHSAASRVKKTS